MNLLFGGGSLGGLMKPHMYRRLSPKQLVRSWLRQNILWSAAKASALQHEIVQRSMSQLSEHNHEELDSLYTRPTLDLYLCNKYWNFITGDDLSKEEVQDLETAKSQLTHYEKIYSLMEYGSDLNQLLTALETRIASNNPSLPQTIYRKSRHNESENVIKEVEACLAAYYSIIDDAEAQKCTEWVRKAEEDIGQNIALLFINFDESVRDELVSRSPLFARFDLEKQKFFK
jgi:hypothetical protein